MQEPHLRGAGAPWREREAGLHDESIEGTDDMSSISMSMTVDDMFAFTRNQPHRCVDSDVSGFYGISTWVRHRKDLYGFRHERLLCSASRLTWIRKQCVRKRCRLCPLTSISASPPKALHLKAGLDVATHLAPSWIMDEQRLSMEDYIFEKTGQPISVSDESVFA